MILIATEGMDDIVPARRIRLRAKGRSHDGLSPELAWQRLTMSGRLFLSFWDLCLDNLPQGRFERRAIAAVDAGAMIRTARGGNTLLCVIKDYLLAPHRARERRRHEELWAVLRGNYHWSLAF